MEGREALLTILIFYSSVRVQVDGPKYVLLNTENVVVVFRGIMGRSRLAADRSRKYDFCIAARAKRRRKRGLNLLREDT